MEADGIHGKIKRKPISIIQRPPHVYTAGAMMVVVRSTCRAYPHMWLSSLQETDAITRSSAETSLGHYIARLLG